MDEMNKKNVKVKLRVVAFNDLQEFKTASFKEIKVGELKDKSIKTITKENIE